MGEERRVREDKILWLKVRIGEFTVNQDTGERREREIRCAWFWTSLRCPWNILVSMFNCQLGAMTLKLGKGWPNTLKMVLLWLVVEAMRIVLLFNKAFSSISTAARVFKRSQQIFED